MLRDNKESNEIKEENIKEKEIINNENNIETEEKEEEDKIEGTKASFIINNVNKTEENKDMELLDNKENQKNEKSKNVDVSTLVLKNNDSFGNNNLSQLNVEKSEINKNDNNLNQSFMQRTKSWMSNIWTNVKNYDYGKYNIFKKEEMEDCLDAHGNHIKIPKKKEEKKVLKVKENKDEDFMKYNNLDYNRYYSNYNANVFAGYPF